MAEIELTLNSPLTEEQLDTITDVDFDHTNRIWFHTKHDKQVEFVKVKPVTSNADRIRAMSDWELADFIGGIFTVERDAWGDYDPRLVVTQEPRVEVRDKEDIMDWLQSPTGGMISE